MPDALIIAYNAERLAESLHEQFPEVTFATAATPEEAEPHYAAASVLMAIEVPADLVERMPRLDWVQALIAGVDRFEAVLESRPDVLLTSARGIHGIQMSEMVAMHMLAATRQLPRMVRNQDRHRWEQFDQPLLNGKRVTIVGVGTAGEATARLCKALGMRVYAVSRTERPIAAIDRFYDRSELIAAVREADYVVVTVDHTPSTDGLVDARAIESMHPGAYLINVARGAVVDERALARALEAGRIAGAGLDVVEGGQLGSDSPLWDVPNLTLTPHLGGRSDRYAEQVATVVEPNLRYYLAGDRDSMVNVVPRRAAPTDEQMRTPR